MAWPYSTQQAAQTKSDNDPTSLSLYIWSILAEILNERVSEIIHLWLVNVHEITHLTAGKQPKKTHPY